MKPTMQAIQASRSTRWRTRWLMTLVPVSVTCGPSSSARATACGGGSRRQRLAGG